VRVAKRMTFLTAFSMAATMLCFGIALANEGNPGAVKPAPLVSKEKLSPGEHEQMRSADVTGTISYVDNRGIAIETGPSAEIYLTMSSTPRLYPVKSLKELEMGDLVRVRYETVYKENTDQGQKKEETILKTTAVAITLIKPVGKGLR